jgi:DNA (cytosine-5)-methyltransferase 1
VTGTGTPTGSYRKIGRAVRLAEFREIMGMPWANRHEISEAIPPAYTEYVGKKIMAYLEEPRA